MESLLLPSLDIPTAQLAINTLDREQMVERRKRGGLLQPDWLIRIINPLTEKIWHKKEIQKTDLERIIGHMMRLVREKEKQLLQRRRGEAQKYLAIWQVNKLARGHGE